MSTWGNGFQLISKCYCVCGFMFLHVPVRLEAVQQFSVENESEGSVRLQWRGISGARAYRLVWGPFTGQDKADSIKHVNIFHFSYDLSLCIHYHFCFSIHKGRNVETVEVSGDRDYYTLSRLQPDVEYIVTIIPLYEGNTEGPGAPARFKIGRCSFSSSPPHGTCLSLLSVNVFVFTAPFAISKLLTGFPPLYRGRK